MSLPSKTTEAFFELVRAGLWEREARIYQFGDVHYSDIQRLSEEQSVPGLVTAGLEHVIDAAVPKEILLKFIGFILQIEDRNKSMNSFIAHQINKMRKEEIYTLLVKGQGVAQCYERPLWRVAGDVDFYLSKTNYEKAKAFLSPFATYIEQEDRDRLHFGMTIDPWVVELHGTMHTGISRRMNVVSDEVHHDIFYNGNVRSWNNNGVQVFLPSPDNDVIIIFNHFVNHFYGEGIGLRQICDWCRILWTYREKINLSLLGKRLKKMGLMNEWKAFGSFAVSYLGMPEDAMPFYSDACSHKNKAKRICKLILDTGSTGRINGESYRKTSSKMRSNMITFFKRFKEFARITPIFPVNAPRFFVRYVLNRVKAVL